MSYLSKEDFYSIISKDDLDAALDGEYADLDSVVAIACEEVVSWLRQRYRISSEMRKTGEQRNRYIMMITMDCALFHLFSSIPGRLSDEDIRTQRYKNAVKWLREAADGALSAGIPTLSDAFGEDDPEGNPDSYKRVLFESQTKMTNDY